MKGRNCSVEDGRSWVVGRKRLLSAPVEGWVHYLLIRRGWRSRRRSHRSFNLKPRINPAQECRGKGMEAGTAKI